jgi:hypothetical protein
VSSIEDDDCSGAVDCREEVPVCFVVARCNGSVLLESGEEVFDQMARFVYILIVFTLDFAIGFRRNDGSFSRRREGLKHALIGIVGFIGDNDIGADPRQQDVRSCQIMRLAGRKREAGGVAQSVAGSVNLGRQPAFTAPDGLAAVFLRAPALC